MKYQFKLLTLLVCLLFFGGGVALSQTANRVLSGTVISAEDNTGLPGVSVVVKGTTTGTITNLDGDFKISVPEEATHLVFSYVGFENQEVEIGDKTNFDVSLTPDSQVLGEVVVTALGISKKKQALGYATQQIGGEEVATAREVNVTDALSGKFAGVDIKKSPVAGGSTNVVIRGYSSITGNNQALFVVDGIPINNDTHNSSDSETGRGGYDYGNAAADINPDDIESINVLKGAAATVLYGSRAANGAVIITTKKGKHGKKGIGVSFGTSFSIEKIDKKTFAEYQKEYGQGYGPYYGAGPGGYFNKLNLDGETGGISSPTGEDGSAGAAFDPSLMVYDWRSYHYQLGSYKKKFPWVAGANDPSTFFTTGYTNTQNVAVTSRGEQGSVRLGFTRSKQTGNLPNSEFNKNTLYMGFDRDISDKLSIEAKATYVNNKNKGRYVTGYNNNLMSNFRQWWATNVDLKQQKEAYEQTGLNMSWNPSSFGNTAPKYWNNPYFQRHKNYTTDSRDRVYGFASAKYKFTDYLNLMGRITADSYSELREERVAVGSQQLDLYRRRNYIVSEYNYDLFLNFDKSLTEKIGLSGMIGTNYRRNSFNSLVVQTNGGLGIPDVYVISNSKNPISFPVEREEEVRVFGIFGQAILDYNDLLYLEATLRRDVSSTLPKGKNAFIYPAVSASFIFSNLVKNDLLSYGKFRASYAEVGNSPGPHRTVSTFNAVEGIGGRLQYSNPQFLANANLKEERTKEKEIGLEMSFLKRRIGFDLSLYDRRSQDQIFGVAVSSATGFETQVVNSGEVQTKGIELQLYGSPIKTQDLEWKVGVNYAGYKSKVLSLYRDSKNLLVNTFFGVSLNATLGQPYGVLKGTDYVYHNGKRVVRSDGKYHKTKSDQEVLGDINPDFKMGITNKVSWKNLSLGFLIDIQKGGDFFSGDLHFGMATGLYPETVGNNDLGKPKRNKLSEGGGVILDGVKGDVEWDSKDITKYTVTNAEKNDIRTDARTYANPYGRYGNAPDKQFVYDASYVKLRELTLSYRLPKSLFESMPIQAVQLSLVGRNLWIIHKNVPYADPEQNFGAGNIQGYQVGAYPSVRQIGFNLKVDF